MKKLGKYLKPFTLAILASVCLLFVQAMSELNLPNYMSDIVNVGIQQGGIAHASTTVMSENAFELMQVFMDEEDLSMMKENYELKDASEIEGIDFDGVVYSLKEVDEEVRKQLDGAVGRSSWTMLKFFQGMAQQNGNVPSKEQEMNTDNIDFTQLYQGLPMLKSMPKEMFAQAKAESADMPESMLEQTGSVMAKLFYEEVGADTSNMQISYIVKTGFMMLAITLIGAIASIAVGFLSSKIGSGLARKLRKDVFAKVESFSNTEFDKFSTSSLITRTTNDITQIQMLVIMSIRLICYAPIMGIGGIIMILQKNNSMSWILALGVIVLMLLVGFIFKTAMPKFKIMQKLIDGLNLVSRENLSGLMVVRAFGAQEFEEKRFDKANLDLTKTSLFVNRVMVFMMPAMMLIMNMITLLIVWVGAHEIGASAMQVGDMMAFMQYAMQVIMSFLMISMIFIMVPRASVSVKRVFEVLDTEPKINDPKETKPFDESKRGYVEFDHVSFHYDGADEDVITDVSFVAKPQETTAFIGSTGSGKSTLINLIPRFYDVTSGSIKVNGVDVRDVKQHDLHEQIGYVPQKGILLSGTIESNIKYGKKDATREDVINAANIAQAEEFISSKEEGYDSSIAQGGTNVSGGQKQRLSIARALATQAPIYIFDDSFSALDFKTDAALRGAIKEKLSNATLLIVAQRVSTIMHANQIIVLDEGKVVGKGTHEELLKNCPTYYEIAASQLSEEEL